jgi:circadian clock protein KaiB
MRKRSKSAGPAAKAERPVSIPAAEYERAIAAAAAPDTQRYVLRLYISGLTPAATRALANLKKICEEHLPGRYEMEVIDVYQQPVLAKGEQILAAPTLIKALPLPLRRIIGDMSNRERVLLGLDLRPQGGK